MSLFDVIKYPISYPPTKDQLEALPPKLFTQWMIDSGFEDVPQWTPLQISYHYVRYSSMRTSLAEIKALRKMVEEYDE